ncbi:YdcF family protein [Lacticaseibacillus songhuajiangensis]|uniref:YdcF family protein n=1 Tax=Lacticaseibacillus songhuajiangensis TaxID=1296539 RepID=UPI001CDCD9E0|nr:YdcF family protein [Lacticaseibacillus songhuajiangensis]
MNDFVYVVLAMAAITTLAAGISLTIEPRRLINGLLINIALACDIFCGGTLVIATGKNWLIYPALAVFGVIVILIVLFFALHLVWLIWNAIIVWRKESHSLANMLTLLLAVAIVIVDVFGVFGQRFLPTFIYEAISSMIALGTAYLLFTLWNFLTVLVAYNLRRPLHNQDFLIVLGAGLIDGHKVSRLLGARIDVAIAYYQKQRIKGRPLPRIIFSGGQGGDEQLSEGAAMRQYALDHGIPEEATLLEDRSRTTLENMQFSARIINDLVPDGQYRAQFCTNNYHLFRAGLFAKEAGLNANGMGAHTAFYFLPNATIREFAAVFLMNKRRHAISLGILSIPSLIIFIGGIVNLFH